MKRLLLALMLMLPLPVLAAIPTYIGDGGIEAGSGDLTPGINGSTLEDDVMLLYVASGTTNPAPSGGTETWVETADSPETITDEVKINVFWARASQDTPTGPTVGSQGGYQMAIISTFRGVILTGDPWDVTSSNQETGSDTSGSATGDTTTVDDCLVVIVAATNLPDANGTAVFSGWTNGDLSGVAERTDNSTDVDHGGGLGTATGGLASLGSYGATTYTTSDSTSKVMITIALKPEPAAGATGNVGIDLVGVDAQ